MAEFLSSEAEADYKAALLYEFERAKAAGYERLEDVVAEMERLGVSVPGAPSRGRPRKAADLARNADSMAATAAEVRSVTNAPS